MKIIAVSDSHGSLFPLKEIMNRHRNADVVIHCGDSRREMEEIKLLYPDKEYHEVKGNCDFSSMLPEKELFTLDGVRFFVTHGHLYNVKYTLTNLDFAAREVGADVALFGHTHQPLDTYHDGLHLINPGSCGGYQPTYAVIETKNGEVLSNIAYVFQEP